MSETTSQDQWKPSCSLDAIKARAEVYALIRAFFDARNVLEVETPILSQSTATDPYLDSVSVELNLVLGLKAKSYYLHTSPEFPMKRLLAAGSGSIYQICKTFRNAETGHRHNPEFTMLEWYRLDFSLDDLMAEVENLVGLVLSQSKLNIEKISYRDAFKKHVGIDPFVVSQDQLMQLAAEKAGLYAPENKTDSPSLSRDDYLNALLATCIEPNLGRGENGQLKPVFIHAYPPSQASLARLKRDASGELVAERFELYIDGLEIANGYFELTDAQEQKNRFEEDNRQRKVLGLATIPVDERLIGALKSGLPECSGVALGLDRLLMVKQKKMRIEEVINFPITRA